MNQHSKDPQSEGPKVSIAGLQSPADDQGQELTLEQLESYIAHAESLHQDLSIRLDAVERD